MAILRDSRGRFRSPKSKYLEIIGKPVQRTIYRNWFLNLLGFKPIVKHGFVSMRYDYNVVLIHWENCPSSNEKISDFPELKNKS